MAKRKDIISSSFILVTTQGIKRDAPGQVDWTLSSKVVLFRIAMGVVTALVGKTMMSIFESNSVVEHCNHGRRRDDPGSYSPNVEDGEMHLALGVFQAMTLI